MRYKADLHIHTTYSDGRVRPDEILDLAYSKGLKAISITDHDTIKGYLAGLDALQNKTYELELIPGVELTAMFRGKEIHVLGYFFDAHNKALRAYLTKCSVQRRNRMKAMIEWLNQKNVEVSFEEVRASAGDATLARPHLAKILVEKNYVRNALEAFNKFLIQAHEATSELYFLDVTSLIALVKKAGGAIVLAHPASHYNKEELESIREMGIDGVECIHPSHSYEQHINYVKWAHKHHLLQTGGSDYHGHPDYGYTPIGTVAISMNEVEKMRSMTHRRKQIQ
jgi:predicted metal-dependent phosphoesterase TrpH